MPALAAPVLTLAVDSLEQNLHTSDNIYQVWSLFSKCKDGLTNGRRLENMSWRLWYRSTSCKESLLDLHGVSLSPDVDFLEAKMTAQNTHQKKLYIPSPLPSAPLVSLATESQCQSESDTVSAGPVVPPAPVRPVTTVSIITPAPTRVPTSVPARASRPARPPVVRVASPVRVSHSPTAAASVIPQFQLLKEKVHHPLELPVNQIERAAFYISSSSSVSPLQKSSDDEYESPLAKKTLASSIDLIKSTFLKPSGQEWASETDYSDDEDEDYDFSSTVFQKQSLVSNYCPRSTRSSLLSVALQRSALKRAKPSMMRNLNEGYHEVFAPDVQASLDRDLGLDHLPSHSYVSHALGLLNSRNGPERVPSASDFAVW